MMCHLVYANVAQWCKVRLKIHRESNMLLSWTQLILTSLCISYGFYHSFKFCVLAPSLLFQPQR